MKFRVQVIFALELPYDALDVLDCQHQLSVTDTNLYAGAVVAKHAPGGRIVVVVNQPVVTNLQSGAAVVIGLTSYKTNTTFNGAVSTVIIVETASGQSRFNYVYLKKPDF